jgi:hypothetical protein
MEGWIKLHRKFIEWEWFNISEMVHLFIYLLLLANREPGEWRGIKINRGQLITGRNSLSEGTGISQQTIRTCLSRLKSTSEITIKSTNKYSIITIIKYDDYQNINGVINQLINQPSNKQLTSNQPATNHKQEGKEDKEGKKERKKRDFTPPTLEDVEVYFGENGYKQEAAIKAFNYYNCAGWKDRNGNQVKSWKQKMITVWFKDENKIPSSKPKFVF